MFKHFQGWWQASNKTHMHSFNCGQKPTVLVEGIARQTRDRAGDTLGRPQGLTTGCRVVPSRVMPGFREKHLFTNSMSQHFGRGATGTAGVPLYSLLYKQRCSDNYIRSPRELYSHDWSFFTVCAELDTPMREA